MLKKFLYSPSAQLATAVILSIALLAFWQWAVGEEKSILKNSSVKVDSESATLLQAERGLQELDRILARYRHNLEEIRYFRETFLAQKEDRVVRISDFLEQKARARRIRMDEIRYQTGQSKDRDLEIYQLDLPLIGKYRDIRAFVGDIEDSDIFLVINQLALEDDADREGAVRVQLSLATYFEAGGHE